MFQRLAEIKLHSISSATEMEGIGVSGNCEKSQDREKTATFCGTEKLSTDKEKLMTVHFNKASSRFPYYLKLLGTSIS